MAKKKKEKKSTAPKKNKKKKKKLSTYDKEIILPLLVAKVMLFIYALVNIFTPVYQDYQFAFKSMLNFIPVILMCVGVYAMHGHFGQIVPLFPITILRLVQFFLQYMRESELKLVLPIFGIFILLDAFFIAFLMYDRVAYTYIEEK